MKKNLAIYLALFLLGGIVSCGSDSDEAAAPSPYAFIKSFSIGDIRSEYPAFTSTGEDTTVTRTVSTSSFKFTIDQLAGEVYNNDSLPYCTNVSKVPISMSVLGIPSIYVDSADTYEAVANGDSIDFRTPRKFRIYGEGGSFYKDYTVSVNVHQVDPELMVWSKYPAAEGIVPVRAVEFEGSMLLFGTDGSGANVVAKCAVEGTPEWACSAVSGLSENADFATVQRFGGKLFVVDGGTVYSSADALNWSVASGNIGAVAIVGASDAAGELWIAGEQGLYMSNDGNAFEQAGALPQDFPLYGVSVASYPLAHNNKIIRYMLAGYTTAEKNGKVAVWSKLSTEQAWSNYENVGNEYPCPALKNIAVVRYNASLYALGGAGVAYGNEVEAFSSLYVSKDNGIVWKEPAGFYQRLPKELLGENAAFAVAVDSGNYMWIIISGENGGTWKGIINRLGFKK